jgi:hypothetical protein
MRILGRVIIERVVVWMGCVIKFELVVLPFRFVLRGEAILVGHGLLSRP